MNNDYLTAAGLAQNFSS